MEPSQESPAEARSVAQLACSSEKRPLAPGTSSSRSSRQSAVRLKPASRWLRVTCPEAQTAKRSRRIAVSACGDSTAATSARLTISWWKYGIRSARRQRHASSTSSLCMYSASSFLSASLAWLTVPFSGPPHVRSVRSAAWRAWSRRSAATSTSAPPVPASGSCASATKAGGRTSSTMARTRKRASSPGASGTSSWMSSVASSRWRNPLLSASCESADPMRLERSVAASSRSRSPRSSAAVMRRLTKCGAYVPACTGPTRWSISANTVLASPASPLVKYSRETTLHSCLNCESPRSSSIHCSSSSYA
mmetsp:Transcript_23656/g.76934  ORF Transcript_23656/g.76934 Transcript_23656/m.76934 type:complete len:307 (+) Transcript_23656:93-1013(+)